jgi:integrase
MTFVEYFEKWVNLYKVGAVRDVTLKKYMLTLSWLKKLAGDLQLSELNRIVYQEIINKYSENHEKQTVYDFHHHLKSVILDAIDDGLVEKDPTRKVVIKGKQPRKKKIKFLNLFELQKLISDLKLDDKPNYDWLILLIAKTGMRCSEAVALTPNDFDFNRQYIIVNKTWNYKDGGGFVPTKNKSSVRNIQIDWQIIGQFSNVIKGLPKDEPIFVSKDKPFYNSTLNDILVRHCKRQGIPEISVHGLRHTHASILLASGVSIASVSRRLGHSDMATTQKVYLHIIQELDDKDTNTIMRTMAIL